MGVKDLWAILAPAMVPVPLADLKGQTLAVDLSIWIVETQGVRQMQGVVTKPYLRNLFFRINHLLQLGVNLIFVIEGEAPKLKWETMAQRTQVRYGGAGRGRGNPTTQKPPTRSHFNAVIKECCHLLDAIGIPYVQSAGEAEAKCAFLNTKGIVDGCLTDDGDVFLYGATKVYRNFTMKDPHIESYDMTNIEEKLGLDRSHMVALGLLLGCDYVPKGVPGVGREMALKFFKHIGKENVLERFDIWVKNKKHYAQLEATSSSKKPSHCSQCKHPGSAREHDRKGCTLCHSSQHCEPQTYDYVCPCDWHHKQQEVSASTVELNIQKRAIKTSGFPWPKVVEEFMISRDKVPKKELSWHCPRLNPFMRFCETKMEWVDDYSREKLLPLMTLWGMRAQLGIYGNNGKQFLEPHCIVKPRVRLGVPCFEVQWQKLSEDCTFKEDHFTTIEEAYIFTQCFPETVVLFEARKPVKTKRKPGKVKDDVSDKENVGLSEITTAISDMKLSNEKENSSGIRSAEQMRHRKGEERCVLGSEEKTIIQPDEVQIGNKVRAMQSVKEGENKASPHLHEQNMTWKDKTSSEPLRPMNSRHLDLHKGDIESSLYRQNCSASTTQHIEKPKTTDLKSSAESSSEEEEYLPLSQRLALLPKVNQKPADVKARQTSFTYRVNNKSTAVKVGHKPGIKVNQMPLNFTESQKTNRGADVASDTSHNGNCDNPNVSDEAIENQLDHQLVFGNTKTEEGFSVLNNDCTFGNTSMQVKISMPPVQVVTDQPSESELQVVTDQPSKSELQVVTDQPSESELQVVTDQPSESELQVVTDQPSESELQVVTDQPSESELQVVTDQPSESELISLFKGCSLQTTPAVLDGQTTEETAMAPSCYEGIDITSSSYYKDPDEIVKTIVKSGGAEGIRAAVNARECLGKRSVTAGGRRKLTKGKVRKSSKPWYTESVLNFSSDDDLVFGLPEDDTRGRNQTSSHTELKGSRGSLTDDAEMILEKSSYIKDCKLDYMMTTEEKKLIGKVYQSNRTRDFHSTSVMSAYTNTNPEDITEERGILCTTKQDLTHMEAPEEGGHDTCVSGKLEQSDEQATCSVLEGGFIREDSISGTEGLDDSCNLSQLEGGFYRERTASFIKGIYITNGLDETKEAAEGQTDIGSSIYEEAPSDSRYNSDSSDSLQDTSSELSATDLFDNSSKSDHECDVTASVKNNSLSSFLDETPTVIFIDTPFSSPITEMTTGMKSLHKIVEYPKLKTNAMAGRVTTTAANWNKSQFGNFSMGNTLLDITCDSNKPDTSRNVADNDLVSPGQPRTYEAAVHSDLGSANQSFSPSTTNDAQCDAVSPDSANSVPCDAMTPDAANSVPCDAITPYAANSVPCDAITPYATNSVPCDAMTPDAAYSVPCDAMTPDAANSVPCDAITPYATNSVPCDAVTPDAANSVPCDAVSPATVNNVDLLYGAMSPFIANSRVSPGAANSALCDVTSPGRRYDAMSRASSGSALYDTMIPASATSGLRNAMTPDTVLSDAKLPVLTSSPADTSVFVAASPIPLAQRLMQRVGSDLLTQFSQPSQSLRGLSQRWTQQRPQYSNTQPLKSKYSDFDESDITLLGTE